MTFDRGSNVQFFLQLVAVGLRRACPPVEAQPIAVQPRRTDHGKTPDRLRQAVAVHAGTVREIQRHRAAPPVPNCYIIWNVQRKGHGCLFQITPFCFHSSVAASSSPSQRLRISCECSPRSEICASSAYRLATARTTPSFSSRKRAVPR